MLKLPAKNWAFYMIICGMYRSSRRGDGNQAPVFAASHRNPWALTPFDPAVNEHALCPPPREENCPNFP